jgi:4-amino-4-deoxy-L-arabinose transferase-like glycosyltransferase
MGTKPKLKDKNDKKRKDTAVLLLAIPLFAYLAITAYVWDSPFIYDEGVYVLMTAEFSDNPLMVIPSATGEHPEWKPPLFSWIYSVFYFFLKWLPIPVEMAMRAPSAIFGAASVCLTFLVGEKLYNRRAGIFAAAILACTPLMVFCSVIAMMEALSIFLSLAAIYSYLEGKIKSGTLLLGLLVLTKGLYVIVPVPFLVAYFWRKKEFRSVMLSFLAIPAAFGIYFLLAVLFGDFGHAFDASLAYIIRGSAKPATLATLKQIAWNMRSGLYIAFPLSTLFLIAGVASRRTVMENLPVAVMASIAVVSPLFPQFIFWYMSLSLPGLALFFGGIIDGVRTERNQVLWLLLLISATLMFGDKRFYSTPYPTGAKEVAEFAKGKSVLFVEPGLFYQNWIDTNRNYLGTDAERLVLEQHNPGFLFYRFGESKDYGNLKTKFIYGVKGTYAPSCSGYLVVHERDRGLNYTYSVEIPGFYEFLWRKGDYAVWKGRADCQ